MQGLSGSHYFWGSVIWVRTIEIELSGENALGLVVSLRHHLSHATVSTLSSIAHKQRQQTWPNGPAMNEWP